MDAGRWKNIDRGQDNVVQVIRGFKNRRGTSLEATVGNLWGMQLGAEEDGRSGEKSLFKTGLRKKPALAKRQLSEKEEVHRLQKERRGTWERGSETQGNMAVKGRVALQGL